ncbi:MAG: hypothetical protein AAGD25_34425 [Cyanobacteria bacterium P01_F01_bin.150]
MPLANVESSQRYREPSASCQRSVRRKEGFCGFMGRAIAHPPWFKEASRSWREENQAGPK